METELIEILKRGEYRKKLVREPVLTESSQESMGWPRAVKFAASRDTVLLSLCEATIEGIEVDRKDKADMYHVLRTTAVYLKDRSGKYFVAFDDSPDPRKNILLARAQEGGDAYSMKGTWLLPRNDYFIKKLLARADKHNRIVEVEERPQKLTTQHVDGDSEFSSNRTAKALYGRAVETCGRLLHKRGYPAVVIYEASPAVLESRLKDFDHVEIKGVGLNMNYFTSQYQIVANYPLFFSGFARGMHNPREFEKAT